MRPGSGLEEVDIRRAVIIVGSGAAGLTAALAAKEAGADVTVLEATSTIGGSSALSGGALWAPNNQCKQKLPQRTAPNKPEHIFMRWLSVILASIWPIRLSIKCRVP